MKYYYLFLLFVFYCNSIYAQNVLETFKEFYRQADYVCYEQKIQHSLHKFDKWLIDSLPLLSPGFDISLRPGNIDLQKKNKVFVLAVTLANTENYNFEDNIYDYLIIDSLRSFIIVCIDDKMNVTGITDTEEPGSYIDLKDDFYFPSKKKRNQIKKMIRNINKEKPDILLFCERWYTAFLYIKGDKIFYYNMKTGKGEEFNKHIRKCPDINIIRYKNRISLPYSKSFGSKEKPLFYRHTGNTPQEEIRLCPSLIFDMGREF